MKAAWMNICLLKCINVLGGMTHQLSLTFITGDELTYPDVNNPNSMGTIYSTEGFLITDEGHSTLFDILHQG